MNYGMCLKNSLIDKRIIEICQFDIISMAIVIHVTLKHVSSAKIFFKKNFIILNFKYLKNYFKKMLNKALILIP